MLCTPSSFGNSSDLYRSRASATQKRCSGFLCSCAPSVEILGAMRFRDKNYFLGERAEHRMSSCDKPVRAKAGKLVKLVEMDEMYWMLEARER